MPEDKNKLHYWWERWRVVAFSTLISALIVVGLPSELPSGLSMAEKIAIPLGIGLGFAFSEKVLHTVWIVDLWVPPILFAAILASVLGPLFTDDPSWSWMHVLVLAAYSVFVMVLVQLAFLLVSKVMDRVSREELSKEDRPGTVSPAAGLVDIGATSATSDAPTSAEIRDTHPDYETRMRSAGALFDVIGILSIAVGLLSFVATEKDSINVLMLVVTAVGVFFLSTAMLPYLKAVPFLK